MAFCWIQVLETPLEPQEGKTRGSPRQSWRLVHVSVLDREELFQLPHGFRFLLCSTSDDTCQIPLPAGNTQPAAGSQPGSKIWGKTAALLGQLSAARTSAQHTKESGTRADPEFLGRTSQRTGPG